MVHGQLKKQLQTLTDAVVYANIIIKRYQNQAKQGKAKTKETANKIKSANL